MSKNIFNIIIVETSHIIYEGISSILSNTGQSFNILQAESLNELQQLNLKTKTDLVIINPVLIQNIIKDFQLIKKDFNNTNWIALAYTIAEPNIISLFDSIIYINDTPNKIISTIQKLLLPQQHQDNQIQKQETLSERETDVLKLLVDGNANKEIADKLNISTNTVISHRKNISQKTGIKSVSGLTIYAVVNNIITIDNYRE